MTLHIGTRVIGLCLGAVLGCLVFGCASKAAQPGSGGASGGASGHVACTPAEAGVARPHELGNYDNLSCNQAGCHGDMIGGGWVYTNPKGPPPFVDGATITIYNDDGSIVTSVSAVDGFFQITEAVKPLYKVCVSDCPGTNCSVGPHPNADCQTSNCHGKPGQKIYVSLGSAADAGTGTHLDGGAENCAQPASGGPYTHTEPAFGQQACSSGGCHCAPSTIFQGGFLYDGPTSTTTVAQATITLTPASGVPIKMVSGVGGMFFIGTLGDTVAPITLTAPYTACISNCATSVCSITNGHTTTGDCQTSQCHVSPLNVYLR